MFPKPTTVVDNYKVDSASRDPESTGRRLAKFVARNYIFFGCVAIAAVCDVYCDIGSPTFYATVSLFTIVPLFVTAF